MPKASVNLQSRKFQLKTCEGGWIELRPLSYSETQHRREIATRTSFYQSRNNDADIPQKVEIDFLNKVTSEFDLSTCVVDHNLYKDDAETQKYDFKNPDSYTDLDPSIGTEIEELIVKLNSGDDLKDSNEPSQPLPLETFIKPSSPSTTLP